MQGPEQSTKQPASANPANPANPAGPVKAAGEGGRGAVPTLYSPSPPLCPRASSTNSLWPNSQSLRGLLLGVPPRPKAASPCGVRVLGSRKQQDLPLLTEPES